MLKLKRTSCLQKFAPVHANVHNHFNLERNLADRQTCKERRSAALPVSSLIASYAAALKGRPALLEDASGLT
jgi:putative transposase